MKNNNTLSYRVGQLEKTVDKLEDRLEKLLTNDIPHLQQEMATVKSRVTVLTIFNVGAIILGVVISKAF